MIKGLIVRSGRAPQDNVTRERDVWVFLPRSDNEWTDERTDSLFVSSWCDVPGTPLQVSKRHSDEMPKSPLLA